MLINHIYKLLLREDFSYAESKLAGRELLQSDNKEQIATFISLLTAKGETVEEVVGLVEAIKEQTLKIDVGYPTVDIVGTGGDNAGTINISTAAALLTAACGVPVLKHGNRAISSKAGAADVLEALGFDINLPVAKVIQTLKKSNFAFCLAPNHNPLFAKVQQVRKKLGFSSIFNLLGPLLNPAGLGYMLIGISDKKRLPLVAEVLQRLGTRRSLVFHGNGLDELSCLGEAEAILVTPKKIEKLTIDPKKLGLNTCTLEDLVGDDAMYNANIIYETLNSGISNGLTDTIVLNTAAALFVFGKAKTLQDGVIIAKDKIKKGQVLKRNRLIEILTHKLERSTKVKSLKQAVLSASYGGVVAEIKRASPSVGKIKHITDPGKAAEAYAAAGACAISVLTDKNFAGNLDDLRQVANVLRNTSIPILRKDFIIYPKQLFEAKEAGADAVLLIVSVLGQKTKEFVKLAHAIGLETLVEVHSLNEIPIAIEAGGDVLGVNQRNLRDFTLHPEIFMNLSNQIPSHIVKIAESGIKTGLDAKLAFNLGYHGVLVGEAISRLDDPTQFFKELKSVKSKEIKNVN